MPEWKFSNLVVPAAVHPGATLASRVIAVVTSTNDAQGQTATMLQPSPRSGSPTYSNSSASKNNSISGSSINASSLGTSLTVGSQHSQPASVTVAGPDHNYITYAVGNPSALDVDHLCTVKQAPNDDVLFTLLKRNYVSKVGLVRAMFSIWQLSHYDFIKVRPPTFPSVP